MALWLPKWHDDFPGPEPGPHWVGGHLNTSTECLLTVSNGVRITVDAGTEYASAGVVTRHAVAGDFAADVAFSVSNPSPGSTLELAAVTVAPPALSVLAPKVRRDCALVFNVHGEPPYVSSEFDEDDGWRIGWNEREPVYRFDAFGFPTAVSSHNRYGDNSLKPTGATTGWLRLVREGGTHWSAWRRGTEQHPWVLVEARDMAAPSLAQAVYLRLVAKHWVKGSEHLTIAPANQIVFQSFALWGRPT